MIYHLVDSLPLCMSDFQPCQVPLWNGKVNKLVLEGFFFIIRVMSSFSELVWWWKGHWGEKLWVVSEWQTWLFREKILTNLRKLEVTTKRQGISIENYNCNYSSIRSYTYKTIQLLHCVEKQLKLEWYLFYNTLFGPYRRSSELGFGDLVWIGAQWPI